MLNEETDLLVYSISNIRYLIARLYDEHGRLIVLYGDTEIPGHEPDFVLRERLDPGTYRLEVKPFYPDSTGPYILYVDAVDDPGDSIDTATPLVFESATPGRIDPGDDEDYFSLTLDAPSYVYVLGVKHYNKDTPLDIAVFDENGNEGFISTVFRSVRSDAEGSGEFLELDFDDGAEPGALRFEGARVKLGAGTHYFRITSRDGRPRPYMLFPVVDRESNRFEQDCLMLGSSQSDPVYGCQWHLNNTGQHGDNPFGALPDINVEGVWATTKGEGVNVAVVDDRVDLVHEDLRDNISFSRTHDYVPEIPWFTSRETHGTAVAGIIAARDDNNVGGRGVAPRATIYGRRITSFERADWLDAMTRDMEEVAVSNNSWGFPDIGVIWFPDEAWEMAVARGVTEGYGGKGIFYVWAGGNGHFNNDDSNFDSRANHYAVTAVCADSYIGARATYSERGSNLWVCGPSSDRSRGQPGITTTHTLSRYRKDFGGTSAAAPMVSGVAALLRSEYPDLTWRDLKLILAGSARRNDPGHKGWEEGAPKYGSTDERYRFNHDYGFGLVDAGAAMQLADGWTSLPAWREISATSDETAEIADLGSVTTSLTLDSYVDFVEFIAIEPTVSHTFYRDLRMELTSPSGATSIIAVSGSIYSRYADPVWVEATPRFGSAKHLGEDAAGEWTLRIVDETVRDSGMLPFVEADRLRARLHPGLRRDQGGAVGRRRHDGDLGGARRHRRVGDHRLRPSVCAPRRRRRRGPLRMDRGGGCVVLRIPPAHARRSRPRRSLLRGGAGGQRRRRRRRPLVGALRRGDRRRGAGRPDDCRSPVRQQGGDPVLGAARRRRRRGHHRLRPAVCRDERRRDRGGNWTVVQDV